MIQDHTARERQRRPAVDLSSEPEHNCTMTTYIFHLALVDDWQNALDENSTYFPPTYEADGFTHGTADAAKLLDVANHFYVESEGDWLCLRMTEESLANAGIEVRYEPAAAVGDQDGAFEGSGEILFPHLMGGIPPAAVLATHAVTRNGVGRFLGIDLAVDIV